MLYHAVSISFAVYYAVYHALRRLCMDVVMVWFMGWHWPTARKITWWEQHMGGRPAPSWMWRCCHVSRCSNQSKYPARLHGFVSPWKFLALHPRCWFGWRSEASPERGQPLPHLGRAFTDVQELKQATWPNNDFLLVFLLEIISEQNIPNQWGTGMI